MKKKSIVYFIMTVLAISLCTGCGKKSDSADSVTADFQNQGGDTSDIEVSESDDNETNSENPRDTTDSEAGKDTDSSEDKAEGVANSDSDVNNPEAGTPDASNKTENIATDTNSDNVIHTSDDRVIILEETPDNSIASDSGSGSVSNPGNNSSSSNSNGSSSVKPSDKPQQNTGNPGDGIINAEDIYPSETIELPFVPAK